MKNIMNKKRSAIITYGFTPPKKNFDKSKIIEISKKQIDRINSIDIDALVIYDIQDEADRIVDKRPFDFLETIDSTYFCENYLADINIPKIVYSCVGKYSESELEKKIESNKKEGNLSVFVGSSSRNQKVNLSLTKAYNIYNKLKKNVLLGGVVIPERHINKRNEHLRIIDKISSGCSFFISQAVYNLEAAKNFLSDYYYYSKENKIELVPIIFTLTPCGSIKTLDFMKWLGINIPVWLENDLINSEDILTKSIELEKKIFCELYEYACEKNMIIGCNIESVSVRKAEIDASIELVKDLQEYIRIK